jgi:predicted N-formylglutamate amidohydrolase
MGRLRHEPSMLQPREAETTTLSLRDPPPVETVNAEGRSPFVLCCEHAGRAVPERLRGLGVGPADMARHIASDVGAEGLSRRLCALLDAPLVLQRYSRLVVDCNRPFAAPDCFLALSDGTPVPGNRGITDHERRRRFEEIHQPFHQALAALLDRRTEQAAHSTLVAVHSFTPRLAGGAERPWHLGALSNRDGRFAARFLQTFRFQNPGLNAAHNEPYLVDDLTDYTIPVHGEGRGIPHLLIEIRNDLLGDAAGQHRWARLLAAALVAAQGKDAKDG